MNENALVVHQAGGLSTLKNRWQTLAQATQEVLKDGIDFGVIPGTKQKTLLKPGAEKLSTLFGLRPFFTLQDSMEDWDKGRFYYRYRCTLRDADGGDLADSEGSCTTMEKKYRWRTQGQTCPACKQEGTIIKGREEYGGGWLCYRKKGGCGAKFKDGDKAIENQPRGRIENPEPYDLINTVQKMAQKRALVAAVLVATGASEFFTQDMEDILDGIIVEDAAKPERKTTLKSPPRRQKSNAANNNGNGAEKWYQFAERAVKELGYDNTHHVVGTLKKETDNDGSFWDTNGEITGDSAKLWQVLVDHQEAKEKPIDNDGINRSLSGDNDVKEL